MQDKTLSVSCQFKVYSKRHLGTEIQLKSQVPETFYYECQEFPFAHSVSHHSVFLEASHWASYRQDKAAYI